MKKRETKECPICQKSIKGSKVFCEECVNILTKEEKKTCIKETSRQLFFISILAPATIFISGFLSLICYHQNKAAGIFLFVLVIGLLITASSLVDNCFDIIHNRKEKILIQKYIDFEDEKIVIKKEER